MPSQHDNALLRIGVFIDGTYFSHVSNYYLYEHERRSRLSITGLYAYIRDEIARQENVDRRFCQIVDAHYFRGRLNAKVSQEQDSLYRERQWDDVLIREGVTMHFLPVTKDSKEKGIDVWFALEAFELAIYKRFNVSVLITGDGDFVPLVRKLNTLGTRVMLLAWDFDSMRDGKVYTTRASQSLINEVTYPIMMSDEIDSRSRKNDPMIGTLFVKPKEVILPASGPEQNGTIISIISERGYGFIRPSEGGDNLFFHVTSLIDCTIDELEHGARVSYRIIQSDRGLNAVEIRLIPA
ncbi:MAG: NYN domain-containing protein [Aliidongia sp.]|jgi:cold shock CspA family protein/uncharacterized LabA/DUF88 family protein